MFEKWDVHYIKMDFLPLGADAFDDNLTETQL